jgi:methionyl-tRNA formyltransferase
MKKSLKIVFFGNESLATGVESNPLVLKTLIDNDYDVCAVVVHESNSTSRKAKKVATIEFTEQQNIPLFNPNKPADIIDDIKALKADIGVLVAYGRIIPQPIIDIFPKGIINLHPSLLPKLRGSTPIETAILEGLTETGVSIMSLTAGMDSGPIYSQKNLPIYESESKHELATKLHSAGADMIVDLLNNIDQHSAIDQNHDQATYTKQIKKSDGQIDWSKPAIQIQREIKAYNDWPSSYFNIKDTRLFVTKVSIGEQPTSKLLGKLIIDKHVLGVQTGTTAIWIDEIKPEGKKEMPIKAFLNGYMHILS